MLLIIATLIALSYSYGMTACNHRALKFDTMTLCSDGVCPNEGLLINAVYEPVQILDDVKYGGVVTHGTLMRNDNFKVFVSLNYTTSFTFSVYNVMFDWDYGKNELTIAGMNETVKVNLNGTLLPISGEVTFEMLFSSELNSNMYNIVLYVNNFLLDVAGSVGVNEHPYIFMLSENCALRGLEVCTYLNTEYIINIALLILSWIVTGILAAAVISLLYYK